MLQISLRKQSLVRSANEVSDWGRWVFMLTYKDISFHLRVQSRRAVTWLCSSILSLVQSLRHGSLPPDVGKHLMQSALECVIAIFWLLLQMLVVALSVVILLLVLSLTVPMHLLKKLKAELASKRTSI